MPDLDARLAASARLQQQMPDVTPWIAPHAALVVLAFALVAVVAATFPRFRTVMA